VLRRQKGVKILGSAASGIGSPRFVTMMTIPDCRVRYRTRAPGVARPPNSTGISNMRRADGARLQAHAASTGNLELAAC